MYGTSYDFYLKNDKTFCKIKNIYEPTPAIMMYVQNYINWDIYIGINRIILALFSYYFHYETQSRTLIKLINKIVL